MALIRALLILLLAIGAWTSRSADAMNFFRGASGGAIAPSWATDQTQQMPYTCLATIWINPSTSASLGAGGGAHYPTGTGTQATPYLSFSDLYASASNATIAPGTCINIVNSTPDVDDGFIMTSLGANAKTGGSNSPTGYRVIRSVDGNGNYVPAFSGGSLNASAAHLIDSQGSGFFMVWDVTTDFWIVDGLNIEGVGANTTQNSLDCLTPGNVGLTYNLMSGPTHWQARNNYIHGCGGAGINTFGTDWTAIQNNYIANSAGAPGYQKSGVSDVVSEYNCATFSLNCAPTTTGYDTVLCTLIAGSCTPYHHVITGNYFVGNYEFGQPPNRTDGNCLIIDTNSLNGSQGQTNAGAYPYATLIANNIAVHCGGVGIDAIVGRNFLMVNNTAYANRFDPGNSATARNDIGCAQTLNCSSVNNIAYAIGPDTFVRTAYTAGGTGPVALDDVKGFILTRTGAAPGPANPIPVTMADATTNDIIGVTIDATNVSTTPGGVSGTVTFTAVVSTLNGALNAAIINQAPTGGGSSPLQGAYAAGDLQQLAATWCAQWVQTTLPCTGSNLVSVTLDGTGDQWISGLYYGTHGSLAAAAYTPSNASPTPSSASNTQADPLFTGAAFAVSPNFIVATLPNLTAAGNGYTAGCLITLAGGSPATAAVVRVDSVTGSGVNGFHLYGVGSYPNTATTSFTQAAASGCAGTGAAFSGATFFQPFWLTSQPALTLQAGSPAKNAGSSLYCLSQDFLGMARPCPSSKGAYQ